MGWKFQELAANSAYAIRVLVNFLTNEIYQAIKIQLCDSFSEMPHCSDILFSTDTKASATANRPSRLNFLTHLDDWLRWDSVQSDLVTSLNF